MKRITRWVFCLLLAVSLTAGCFTAYGADEEAVVAASREAVVRIMVVREHSYSLGTGFGVGKKGEDADTFITNWHVVTSSGQFDYHDGKVYILLDDETTVTYQWIPLQAGDEMVSGGEYFQDSRGTVYQRLVVGIKMGAAVECEVLYAENEYPDVAILRTAEPVRNVRTLPLRKVSQQDVGKEVMAIGYPASADGGSLTRLEDGSEVEKIKASVIAGRVAGGTISRCLPLEAFGNTNCIDHGAHINHGNSGGPLVLKKDGSVIGINTYGYGEQGAEYSVSIYIDYAMEVLDELGLPYTVAGSGNQGLSGKLVIALAGAGILVVLVIAGAVVRKKKKTAAARMAAGGPASAGGPGAAGGPASVGGPASAGAPAFAECLASPGTPAPQPVPSPYPAGGGASSELRLQGVQGVFAGRRFQLKPEIRVGRDPQRCDFVYPSGTKGISGLHCVIALGQTGLTVTDQGSTYGTTVNGRKLAPNQPCPLHVGDKICIGSANEEFQITGKGGAV